MTNREALLVLEDGTAFRGEAFTPAASTVAGEVVFNTAMTGYQEVLTDPSYHAQLVCMAAPEVGNYGTTPGDAESERVQQLVRRDVHADGRVAGGRGVDGHRVLVRRRQQRLAVKPDTIARTP